MPTLKAALAFEVLFGEPVRELFPSLFESIEEEVVTRAYEMYESLQGDTRRRAKTKLDFFETVFERVKKQGDLRQML